MKKSKSSNSSNSCGLDEIAKINKITKTDKISEICKKYKIPSNEIIDIENIEKILLDDKKCPNCKENSYIEIKKFKPIDEQLDMDKLNNDFGRCSCRKRHIDIVMANVLKIMKEENIDFRRFTLRNGPIPLLTPMLSNKDEPFIGKNSLVILHPEFTKDIANKIIEEIHEVKGVIKGNPNDTVGLVDINSEANVYELLAGSDIRSDIVESHLGQILINKIQHLSYLEFPPSMENKINRLWEYIQTKQLTQEEIENLNIIDGMCGNGTLGIFLLKLGVKKVIFNDIWKPSTIMTSTNLNANGLEAIGDRFEVYNLSFEELAEKLLKNSSKTEKPSKFDKFDLCILDCFPSTDTTNLEKIAKSLAKDVLII